MFRRYKANQRIEARVLEERYRGKGENSIATKVGARIEMGMEMNMEIWAEVRTEAEQVVMGRQGMTMESWELMAGYGWGLGGGSGLDGRMTCWTDKAWYRMRLFITGDKDMAAMGPWHDEGWHREAWQDED
jgi:hypothetical protein